MTAQQWRSVQVAGRDLGGGDSVPSTGVSAVAVTFTVVGQQAAGLVRADKDEPTPTTSITYMNYLASGNQSNTGVVAVADNGRIQVATNSATDLLIDVQGYYTASGSEAVAPGGYVPIAPKRLVDTRNGTGLAKAKLAGGSSTAINIRGLYGSGIPYGATAAMVNFTITNFAGPTNRFFQAYPSDDTRPGSSYNFAPNITDVTMAQIGLSTTGSDVGTLNFDLPASSFTLDLLVEVVGYFAPGQSSGSFTPAQTRVWDSRTTGHTKLASGATAKIQVAGVNGIPQAGSGISAVTTNLAAIDAGANGGILTLYADGTAKPGISSLIYQPGVATSNMATSALGASGAVNVTNSGPDTVDFVIDVEGWYTSTIAPVQLGDMCAQPSDDRCASGTNVASSTVRLRGRSPVSGDNRTYKFEVWQTSSTAGAVSTKTVSGDDQAGIGVVFTLTRDTEYQYRVIISDTYSTSTWSPWYTFTTEDPDVTNVPSRTIFDNTASTATSLGAWQSKNINIAAIDIPQFGSQGFVTVDLTATIRSTTSIVTSVQFDGDFTAYDGPDVQRTAVGSTTYAVRAGVNDDNTITIENASDQPARIRLDLTGWDSYYREADEAKADNTDYVDNGDPADDPNADIDDTITNRNLTSADYGDVRADDLGSVESIADPSIAGTDAYDSTYDDVVKAAAQQMPTQCAHADPSAGEDPGTACPEEVLTSTADDLNAVESRVAQQNQNARAAVYSDGSTAADEAGFDYSTGTYGSSAPGQDDTIYPDTSADDGSASTDTGADGARTATAARASSYGDGQFRAGGALGIPQRCVFYTYGHYYSRNLSCHYWNLDVRLVDRDKPATPVGHAYFDMFQVERTNPKTHKIVTVWECNERSATGKAALGQLKGIATESASDGYGKVYKSHKQKVTFRLDEVGNAVWTQDVGAPKSGRSATTYATVTFSVSVSAGGKSYYGDFTLNDAFPRRTDNFGYLPGVGSVLSAATPAMRSLSVRDASVARAAAFYKSAQNNIYGSNANGPAFHPGKPGKGNTPLKRIDPGRTRAVSRRNSYWACKGVPKPRPKGYQCDEYPFATTENGGFLFHHPLSQGVLMPAGQNGRAGNLLGQFYARERIAYGDRLWVLIR